MNNEDLKKLARELTIMFSDEEGSEGFGVRLPNIIVVYISNKKFEPFIRNYLKKLNLPDLDIEIKNTGKTILNS